MTNQLSPNARLVLLVLSLSVAAVALASFRDAWLACLIAITVCVLVLLFRPMLMPAGYGAMKVRTLSILSAFSLVATHGIWAHGLDTLAKGLAKIPIVHEKAPWLEHLDFGVEPSTAVLVFVTAVIFIVNYFLTPPTIAGNHPDPLKTDFPELGFEKKLESFCSALRQHLVTTDREANWSPDYYADLEAEVEIVAMVGVTEKRRIVDLQEAMRADRTSSCFLILGDPGAGKSVALRKLARDMIDEVGKTGRVPIYINLREWLPQEGQRNNAWTEQTKPTVQELEAFVMANVKLRGDVFTEDFVDKYFRTLWERGRLFFIFDSFDEIPELLDVNEDSWLLNALSDVISRFICSNPASRGVLASRVFRRPTQAFAAQKILDIRPLSEERMLQALKRFPAFNDVMQKTLFRERFDLIPIVRNPFLMALLGEWVNQYRSLPQTQAQLYESYLKGRLAKCATKIAQYGLTDGDILQGAKDIGWFVFESPAYGLEAPVKVINEASISANALAVIDVLSHARIARVTQGDAKSFAFVHRRFLEYFVTVRLLEQPEKLPVAHIPTDSRGRDVMVLYAQLCDDVAAARLAEVCWSEITKHFGDKEQRMRAIHSLRFLIDAYRSRRAALASFADELAAFIHAHVRNGKNLVLAKICLEGTGLLEDSEAIPVLKLAIEGKNAWLQETAFRACRHLPRVDKELEFSLKGYIAAMGLTHFWRNQRSLRFSLSLTDAMAGVQRLTKLRYLNLLVTVIVIPIILAILPISILFPIGLFCNFVVTITVGLYLISIIETVLPKIRNPIIDIILVKIRKAKRKGSTGEMEWFELNLYRNFWGYGLVLIGCIVIFGRNNAFSYSGEVFWWSLLNYVQIGPLLMPVCWVFLGLMIVDYISLVYFLEEAKINITKIFENGFDVFFKKLVIFSLIISIIALFLTIFLIAIGNLVRWLTPQERNYIGWFFSVGGVLFLFGGGAHQIIGYIQNFKVLKASVVTNLMSRQEIAAIFTALKTKYWRMVFVRKLIEQRTVATGHWPEDFKLWVSDDPALTELAKLEERWLKLDR